MNPASPPPPAGSVEHFAALVARLSAPFAEREAVLREAGLDEPAYAALEARWTAQLAGDSALVDRYVARYTATRAPTASLPPVPVPASTPALRIDGTLDQNDGAAFRAALPFLKGWPSPRIAAPGPIQPAADPGRPDATLELGASLPLPGKPLVRKD
jgi:hypothetical protein